MIKFILVGAEGVSELALDEGCSPWARQATRDEEIAWRQAHEAACKDGKTSVPSSMRDPFVDGTGRPYWLIAVDVDYPEIPAEVRDKATRFDRVVRLTY